MTMGPVMLAVHKVLDDTIDCSLSLTTAWVQIRLRACDRLPVTLGWMKLSFAYRLDVSSSIWW